MTNRLLRIRHFPALPLLLSPSVLRLSQACPHPTPSSAFVAQSRAELGLVQVAITRRSCGEIPAHPHSQQSELHAVCQPHFQPLKKTRSDGAEVAGADKYLWAKEARAGNRSACDFHQDSGDNSKFAGFSRRYIATSTAASLPLVAPESSSLRPCSCARMTCFLLFFLGGSVPALDSCADVRVAEGTFWSSTISIKVCSTSSRSVKVRKDKEQKRGSRAEHRNGKRWKDEVI